MNEVRLFAVLFMVYLAAQVIWSWQAQLAFFRITRGLEPPADVVGKWPLPALEIRGFAAAGLVFIAGGLLGILGQRVGFVIAAVASLVYFGQIRLLDTVQRKVNLIPQILLLLGLAPASVGAWSKRPDLWPLSLVQALLALVYVAAGISKIRNAGWRWADGHALQAYLFRADLAYDVPIARAVATRRPLCAMLSAGVLGFELLGWLLLLSPVTTWAFAACGLAIHAGTLVLMRINYLKYHGAAYLVFAAHPLSAIIAPYLTR